MRNMTNPTSRVFFALRTTLLVLVLATLATAQTTPADIESRVEAIVSKMTLEEKIDLLGGVDGFFTRGVPHSMCHASKWRMDHLECVTLVPTTTVAGGIALAATWNPALAQEVGENSAGMQGQKASIFFWRLVSIFIAHPGMAETLSILAKTRILPPVSLLDSSRVSKPRG